MMMYIYNFYSWLIPVIVIFDILAIAFMVFKEQKRPYSVTVWVLIFLLLPFAGFIFYILAGKGPSLKKKQMFYLKMQRDARLAGFLKNNLAEYKQLNFSKQHNLNDIIEFNAQYNLAPVAINNDVKIYTDIAEQYDDMINDILNAEKSVDILYFIYQKDDIGIKIRDVLAKKAAEGIKIKIIVDDIGSMWTDKIFFKPVIDNGGEYYRFLKGKLKYFNRNLNYRNHRKIAVIDDKIAYTGGANIGCEYMNKGRLPWRDTHIRITGDGVALVKLRFLQDYSYVAGKDVVNMVQNVPANTVNNVLPVQVISSGPDVPSEQIKETYVKLIYTAKKRVWLQTPYYIPDETFASAVFTAASGGIDVRIMIPEKPDKKFVYYATKSFAEEAVKHGAKVYFYPGFIHSKTLVIDDEISSVGTFNIDIRSFKLHFEMTTMLYGKEITNRMTGIFNEDIKKSAVMDTGYLATVSKKEKFIQSIMRLFSPLF